jgi:raffinose/stachyose/melibiose transport system permease protein
VRSRPSGAAARQATALALCALVVVPLALIVLGSLKTKGEAAVMSFALPKAPQWQNYLTVIERGKLGQSFLNSVVYSSLSVVLTVVATSLAAFVLARRRTRLTRALYFLLILGIMLPMNYVALIKVVQVLRLINTRLGVILVYAAGGISFSVFITYGFVGTVPREMDEAAIIDGSGPWGLFARIVFPLLRPVLVTVAVLQFMGSWNDFIIPLYLVNRSTLWPMTLAVYNFYGRFEQEWNLVFADIVLTFLPVLAIYLLGQRFIVAGMTTGALKG